MTRAIRILLIGEPSLIRDGLLALLGAQEEMELLGAVESGAVSMDSAVLQPTPDIAVMHVPDIIRGGLHSVVAVRSRWPALPIIVLTRRLDERGLSATKEIGVEGCLFESDNQADLLLAIRTVAAGKHYLTPSMLSHASGPNDGLTEREREVLKLIATGYRTREIADHLSLSCKTVEKHRGSLMRKLGLRTAATVAAYAITHGYVAL